MSWNHHIFEIQNIPENQPRTLEWAYRLLKLLQGENIKHIYYIVLSLNYWSIMLRNRLTQGTDFFYILFKYSCINFLSCIDLGDNCIQNFHLGRYIVRYRFGNLVKHDFQTYIQQYTSPNENFEFSYPHSNALLQSHLKL